MVLQRNLVKEPGQRPSDFRPKTHGKVSTPMVGQRLPCAMERTACLIVVVLVAVTVSEKRPDAVEFVVGVAVGGDVIVVHARGTGVHTSVSAVYAAGEGLGANARAFTAIAAVVPW